MELEDEGDVGAGHQLRLGIEDQQVPEPRTDRLAVVDRVAEVRDRRQHPGHDPDRQEPEDDHVGARRRHPDAREPDPPVDEEDEADADRGAGAEPADDRDHVVGLVADAHRCRPRARHEDPEDVTADRGEDAEVEDRARVFQRPALEELSRPRPPAVLVGPVAPPGPDDEDRHRRVREDPVEEQRALAHDGTSRPPTSGIPAPGSSTGITSGGANGSSPTSSAGGPEAASDRIRPSLRELSRPRQATTASSTG